MKKPKIAIVQRQGPDGFYSTGTRFWSHGCDSAAVGFERMGYEVYGFNSLEENWTHKAGITKDTPVRGSIQSVRKALTYLGIPEPKNVDIPNELMEFAGRKIWKSTVGAVQRAERTVFVKSLDFQKDLPGHIAWNGYSSLFTRLELPNDYRLLCQDLVQFTNEFRVYVLHGKVIGTRQYEGAGVLTSKEKRLILDMVKAYKNQPAGFALDVGQLDNGKLVVVETNEGFSCGNYGIPHKLYAQIIEARWQELVA